MTVQPHYHIQTLQDGKPFGGQASGTGFNINWQEGPLVVEGERQSPNGAFVETILEVAKERLEFFQQSPFKCEENEEAIEAIADALFILNRRTSRRTDEGKEGTWEV